MNNTSAHLYVSTIPTTRGFFTLDDFFPYGFYPRLCYCFSRKPSWYKTFCAYFILSVYVFNMYWKHGVFLFSRWRSCIYSTVRKNSVLRRVWIQWLIRIIRLGTTYYIGDLWIKTVRTKSSSCVKEPLRIHAERTQ